MKVLSACSALLSDYEALSVLRDLESQQIKEFRHAQPSKTGVTLHQGPLDPSEEETYLLSIPSNLKDVQLEAMTMLSETYRGCAHQTDESVENFLTELVNAGFTGPYGPRGRPQAVLTKIEQLQILNHVPSKMVELYTIVEEMDTRLEPQDADTLLDIIRRTLPMPTPFAEMAVEDGTGVEGTEGIEGIEGAPGFPVAEEADAEYDDDDDDDAVMDHADDFVTEGRVDAEDAVGEEAPDDD